MTSSLWMGAARASRRDGSGVARAEQASNPLPRPAVPRSPALDRRDHRRSFCVRRATRRNMDYRTLGRTGLKVSALGFGCGDVGGLIVRGAPAERERAVARALEAGVNYFDTAASYGNGESERNLGTTLRALGVRPYVGTKVRVPPEATDTAAAVTRG